MRITAAVVEQLDGPFTIQSLELDEPGPGEVLVRLTATGICHTDGLARHGDLPFPLPGVLVPCSLSEWDQASVLGHEGAGVGGRRR
jgi:Zn-dependent alcohol dehydrogenase